jgi:DNA-binding transcriptional LysR family regulator
MNDSHIRTLDLNLLRVFDTLFEERNVTRAAQRLGLTQSAVSHALNRLRFALGDELFVRGPAGMRATPRAAEVGPKVRLALLQIESALAPSAFVPAETERSFSIAAGAYAAVLLLPPVVSQIRRLAPKAEVRVRGAGLGLAEELDAGRADVAIGSFTAIPERFDSLPLFSETMVWAIRADQLQRDETLTMNRLCVQPHVVLAIAEDGNVVGGAVADGGLERRVIWDDGGVVRRTCAERGLRPPPTFFAPDAQSALALVGDSDLAALAPRRLAELHARDLGLVLFDPPYESRPIELVILWRKAHDSAALGWLRDLIVQAASGL